MATLTLKQEEIELIKEVQELAKDKIAERGAYLDAVGDENQDWVIPKLLSNTNLLAPTVPKKYGGRELSTLLTSHIVEELAVGCPGAAAIVATNSYALTPMLVAGSDKIKDQYLPYLTEREPNLAAIAINEANETKDTTIDYNKSDITRISTIAAENDDTIILNGKKDYVINGASCKFMLVLGRSKESKSKSRLQFYFVPAETPGLEVENIFRKVGMRSCHTVEINFTDVELPEEYMIGSRGGGYLLLLQTFDRNLPLVGAIGVGIAKSAYKLALKEAKKNKMLWKTTSYHHFVSSSLAEMSIQIDAARLAVMRAAFYIDTDENYSRVATLAKLYATEVAQQVTAKSVDVIGKLGFMIGHPAEKCLRDAQMLSVIAGSDHLHKYVLASQL